MFDWQAWDQWLSDRHLKAPIAVGVSIAICVILPFDILRLFGETDAKSTYFGAIFTAFIVAGGSAGSIKLFQDVLGFSKQARDASINAKTIKAQADKEEANARLIAAQVKSAVAQASLAKTKKVGL